MPAQREILAVVDQLEKGLATVRRLLAQPQQQKRTRARVPELLSHYTREQAAQAHREIEEAFQADLLSYDAKRGMKRSVTVATEGWSPVKKGRTKFQ